MLLKTYFSSIWVIAKAPDCSSKSFNLISIVPHASVKSNRRIFTLYFSLLAYILLGAIFTSKLNRCRFIAYCATRTDTALENKQDMKIRKIHFTSCVGPYLPMFRYWEASVQFEIAFSSNKRIVTTSFLPRLIKTFHLASCVLFKFSVW